ncbi:MAG: ABC transporter substrate-binding protein [Chloroflexi bacterium]|nr:ABC transporter substrate-binding protein [Chloroflexota bacterium]
MRKKIFWVVVSGLMALSLVMAACGQAAPTTPAPPTAPTVPTTPTAPTPPATPGQEPAQKEPAAPPAPEPPQYGGTITYRIASDPTNWDSGLNRRGGALVSTVYQQFIGLDWTQGPAGSGAKDRVLAVRSFDYYGPEIAESWKMPEIGVWVLQIRKGVHWQPVPSEAGRLMAGRELTADDIVSGFNRLFNRDGKTPDSWILFSQPTVAKTATIEKTGPMEVTVRTPQEYMTAFSWLISGSGFYRIYPPDVINKYGNMGNWRNAVGTGPFMLVDYVPGSQMLYKKNPVYWEKDPVGPGKGNQLPYADELRELIIPDLSTALAALRTGKLDLMLDTQLVDAQSLWKTAPKLEYLRNLSATWVLAMRQDKKDKPYSDVRVRQALMMATDFDSIKNSYYAGQAEIDVWPLNSSYTDWYVPLAQMPQSVQDLYKYNPDRAKQLLKEAGYPNGFKVSIAVQSTSERIDELSIYKDMWAKVGVELVLDIKETGAYATLTAAGNPYEEMLYRSIGPGFEQTLYMAFSRGPAIWNPSHINDPTGSVPVVEDFFTQYNANIFVNMPKLNQLIKDHNRFIMEQAYVIPKPAPFTYNFWWPWLKNNYGQTTGLLRYAWVDQSLKKSMGY